MSDTLQEPVLIDADHSLDGLPSGLDAMPRSVLLNLLRADQRWRWRQGQRVPVEAYLSHLPRLRNDPEVQIELACGEVIVREELGEAPDLTEYRQRFRPVADAFDRRLAKYRNSSAHTIALDIQPVRPPIVGAEASTHQDDLTTQAVPSPAQFKETITFPVPADYGTDRISGYEFLGELGRGSVGVVYKARQVSLNRVVALKMILDSSAVSWGLTRFRAEAEAIAQLQHPNIVQVYEAGEADGRAYFSLEYCPGGSLSDHLDSHQPSLAEAAELAETLAQAVQAAHAAGVVHRDLKPSNILLAADGTPKVSDFGLAKRMGFDSRRLTQSGIIIGTPNYMAPEQAAGHSNKVGPAADIYALGAIFYRLLTGRPPFEAASVWDTVAQVVYHEPVPPRQLRPEIPEDLEAVCLRCLRKDPAQRYLTARELADDLRRCRVAAAGVRTSTALRAAPGVGTVTVLPNLRLRYDDATDEAKRFNEAQKALVGRPVLISLVSDGRVVRQREAPALDPEAVSPSTPTWQDLMPGSYDVRFEGDGVETVTKRGLQVNGGDELRVIGDLVAGRGVRDIDYRAAGSTLDELRDRLQRLEVEVEIMKAKYGQP